MPEAKWKLAKKSKLHIYLKYEKGPYKNPKTSHKSFSCIIKNTIE